MKTISAMMMKWTIQDLDLVVATLSEKDDPFAAIKALVHVKGVRDRLLGYAVGDVAVEVREVANV